MAHHFHRPQRLDNWVVISENLYEWLALKKYCVIVMRVGAKRCLWVCRNPGHWPIAISEWTNAGIEPDSVTHKFR
ncbi:hypothetical protein RvVAR0630_pl01270 (plasmid) [Agrobacterium vitis]|nr:hypothetical protein RvVAR0630_pl01270 [Agrobacterium vitis]